MSFPFVTHIACSHKIVSLTLLFSLFPALPLSANDRPSGVLERALLLLAMLRPGMRFNVGTAGTGASIECFPGYRAVTKATVQTATRFVKVRSNRNSLHQGFRLVITI